MTRRLFVDEERTSEAVELERVLKQQLGVKVDSLAASGVDLRDLEAIMMGVVQTVILDALLKRRFRGPRFRAPEEQV
jgi:hypothetical protein